MVAPVNPVPCASRAVTVERAVGAFLEEHARTSAPNTLKKYRQIKRKLTALAAPGLRTSRFQGRQRRPLWQGM